MSNINKISSEKKTTSIKKKHKQPPSKKMEHIKCSTQRSKTTLNWNQFLAQQNKDITVKKSVPYHKSTIGEKSNRLQILNPKTPTIPVESVVRKNTHVKSFRKFSSAVAIDCEMVGIGDGRENMLARVSLVDENGICLYDTFVKPMEPVVDYRTEVSGVRPLDMVNGKDFKTVQQDVYQIIHDKVLVGHGLSNDLKVLMLSHPKRHVRDTSKYRRLREVTKGGTPSLRILAKTILNKTIQDGEHSSIEDAHATMQIYLSYKTHWENDIRLKHC